MPNQPDTAVDYMGIKGNSMLNKQKLDLVAEGDSVAQVAQECLVEANAIQRKDLKMDRKKVFPADKTIYWDKTRNPAAISYRKLIVSIEELQKTVGRFGEFNAIGVPEEWSPYAAVGLYKTFCDFIDFQREIHAVVASDPHFTAVRQLEDLEGVEGLKNLPASLILEQALLLAEWTPLEAVTIVRRMIHALQDAEMRINNADGFVEDVALTSVDEGDVTHSKSIATPTPTAEGNAHTCACQRAGSSRVIPPVKKEQP